MTDHLLHSRKHFASFFCFLFFVVSLLTFPVQTIAQTRSSQRERRVQMFFAYNPTRPAAGQEVQFQDFSRGNPTSWLWDFGDGQTSVFQNPRHAYAAPGSYKVILTARNNVSSGRVSRTLNVIISVSASFTYGPSYPLTGQAVQFTDTSTGGPISWQWDFGDGTSSTSQNPKHAYATAGSYTVTLTVGFSSGFRTVSQMITIAPSLAASFTFSPSSPTAGQAVQFTDTSTGSPTSWQWSLGDGATSNTQNPSHIYTTAGSFTVSLTVVYSSSLGSRSISQTITVVPPSALSASFTFSPASPVEGQIVQFTDTSTGGPTSWLWNFGDNTTSTSKNAGHVYSAAANYTVTLTVTNSTASKSTSQAVTVRSAFSASFTYSPSFPMPGQAVQFTDTSTGSPTSWQWNFGDNGTSTVQNPSHTYTATGQYWVNLIITKGADSQSTSQMITVRQPGVIRAASPSYTAVKAAVDSAVSGDTVIIPAGSATWTDHLIITKGIYFIGEGKANTVITSNYAPSLDYMDPESFLISYVPSNPSANESCRISGFTIDCASKCYGILLRNYTLNIVNQIRVDHTKIINPAGHRPFGLYGTVYGVADNNEWYGWYITIAAMDITTWNTYAFNFGTADNFYFEDNLFVGSGDYMVLSSYSCGRWCVRYNTYDGSACNGIYPNHDMHGNQVTSQHIAVMGAEIYNNTITIPSNQNIDLLDQRGGKSLVYNNKIYASRAWGQMREEDNDALNPPANSPISGQPQHVSDTYWWSNKLNDVDVLVNMPMIEQTVNYGGEIGLVPKEDRDFWKQKASFDGTTGVGVGLRSARPATCTKGVGYWATDEGRLYRATATNTWTLYYTPYTYPHPLRTLLSTPVTDENK